MKRSRLKLQKMREASVDDLSFPVPLAEQAKFLKLADDFLALDDHADDSHNKVISIDRVRATRADRTKKTA